MSVRFNPHYRLIVVTAVISGPAGDAAARLALDTGASVTTLSRALLQPAGYDPDNAPTKVPIATGSGAAVVPQLPVIRIEALGQARVGSPTPPVWVQFDRAAAGRQMLWRLTLPDGAEVEPLLARSRLEREAKALQAAFPAEDSRT